MGWKRFFLQNYWRHSVSYPFINKRPSFSSCFKLYLHFVLNKLYFYFSKNILISQMNFCLKFEATNNLSFFLLQVTWVRRRDRQLLTVGATTHSVDLRFMIRPSNTDWTLLIHKVTLDDAGLYECQVIKCFFYLKQIKMFFKKASYINNQSNKKIRNHTDLYKYILCK